MIELVNQFYSFYEFNSDVFTILNFPQRKIAY